MYCLKKLSQLAKKHSVDPVLQQQIMDQIRRQNENIAHNLSTQRDRQAADLQAKLANRRSKKQLEVRRLAEEATAQRILKEQESLVDKDGRGGGLDSLQEMTAEKLAGMSMEEQVRKTWCQSTIVM